MGQRIPGRAIIPPGTRRRLVALARALALGMAAGAMFGGTTGAGFRDDWLAGTMLGALAGAVNGATMAGLIFGAEIFLLPTRLGHTLERVPFLVAVSTRVFAYGSLITLVVGGALGWRVVEATLTGIGPELSAAISGHIDSPVAPRLARTVLLVGLAVFALQLSRLVGESTVRDIVLGRYHRPRSEVRFFLFVDVTGSTPLAEQIGPEAIHRFLGEVFRLASDPIDDHRGEVHQYVGDEIVITWPVAEGRPGARPLACFFAIEQAIGQAEAYFLREFGAAPRLRAALHAGPVISGEVGGSRRAIVYHGDVMNTTSRIEQATRDLGRSFLVSGDALERLDDLGGFTIDDLGPRQLRGRAASIRVHAVTARAPDKRPADLAG